MGSHSSKTTFTPEGQPVIEITVAYYKEAILQSQSGVRPSKIKHTLTAVIHETQLKDLAPQSFKGRREDSESRSGRKEGFISHHSNKCAAVGLDQLPMSKMAYRSSETLLWEIETRRTKNMCRYFAWRIWTNPVHNPTSKLGPGPGQRWPFHLAPTLELQTYAGNIAEGDQDSRSRSGGAE